MIHYLLHGDTSKTKISLECPIKLEIRAPVKVQKTLIKPSESAENKSFPVLS